ncbi:MAG: nucleotidyltransferase domain-containing protein, partial [candidate division WOR-3 bacterium]|nr:nucleotidyltransferase domain-containing protein [candidate division WOR-3 bacterium]
MAHGKKEISNSEKQIIISILKNALIGEPILFAYIFGSFITEEKFNDVDVAVFVANQNLNKKSLLEYEIELEQKLSKNVKGYKIDVRILNNAPVSFKYQVIKTGLLILLKDEDAMVDFETLTYTMYFDFAPLRKAYLKEVLNAYTQQ